MDTLVIYDNTGYIVLQMSGSVRDPQGGVQFMHVTVPEGKQLIKIDTSITPNVAVLEDIPKTETELLKEQVNALNVAMANLVGGVN